MDVVKVEQAPGAHVKVDVATELAGKDDNVEVVFEPASNARHVITSLSPGSCGQSPGPCSFK